MQEAECRAADLLWVGYRSGTWGQCGANLSYTCQKRLGNELTQGYSASSKVQARSQSMCMKGLGLPS